MKKSKWLFVILLLGMVMLSYSQREGSLSVEDFKELIPILKDNPTLFCSEMNRFKIGFFPTSHLVKEFTELGMPKEVLACLKKNFPKNLKFHIVQFQCLYDDCEESLIKKLSIQTKESIFDQRASNKAFRNFSRKEIVGKIKTEETFTSKELPSVYLISYIKMKDSGLVASIKLKYINEHSSGGQQLSKKDFMFDSEEKKDVEKSCKEIAFWALEIIDGEIN